MDGMGNFGLFLLGIAAVIAAVSGRGGLGAPSSATFRVAVMGSRDEILQRCERALVAKATSGAKGGFRGISASAALGSIDAVYRKAVGGPNGTIRILVTGREGPSEIEATASSPNHGGADAILSEFRKGFV